MVSDLTSGSGSLIGCGIWLPDGLTGGTPDGGWSLLIFIGFWTWEGYLFLSLERYPSTLNLSLLAFWSTIFENIFFNNPYLVKCKVIMT